MTSFLRSAAVIILSALTVAAPPVSGQNIPTDTSAGGTEVETLHLDGIVDRAARENLDIRRAVLEVRRAQRTLQGDPLIDESTLATTGSVRRSPTGEDQWNAEAEIDVPILPQLSVGAAATVDHQGQRQEDVTITLRPLASGRTTYTEEEAYRRALIRRRHIDRDVRHNTERIALDVMIGKMEEDRAADDLTLEEEKYRIAQQQRDVGVSSFQDVQERLTELVEARGDLFRARRQYLEAWNDLQRLFGPGSGLYDVHPLTLEELEERINSRREEAAELRGTTPVTRSLEELEIELVAMAEEAASIPRWRPTLDITGGVTFPDRSPDTRPSPFGSVRLTISPRQVRTDDLRSIEADMEEKRLEIAHERYGAELEATLRRQTIEIYEEAYAAAVLQERRNRLDLQEAELLIARGGLTEVEVAEVRLNLVQSEINTFRAAATLYSGLGEYLLLFPHGDDGMNGEPEE